jgi:hypothetical protein
MQQLGLKHLRLSISWSRLLPGGRKGSEVNGKAVEFYGSMLDTLTAAGESVLAHLSRVLVDVGQLSAGSVQHPWVVAQQRRAVAAKESLPI